MRKAVNRFLLYAMLAIFVLLTVLLAVINGTNFTMAAEDADRITELIAGQNGELRTGASDQRGGFRGGRTEGGFPRDGFSAFDRMGPDSPELTETMRFFTVRVDRDGSAQLVAYRISAVSESEAIAWAESLLGETTGWTNQSYRYRVYRQDGATYVTVIDQSRELLPCYRILIISLIGELVGILVSFVALFFAAKRLFRPIEEADRKQKRFIADAESEFKVPLTVISANAERIECESGPSDATRAIHKQVNRMTDLVRKLGRLALFAENDCATVSLSDVMNDALRDANGLLAAKGIAVSTSIEPNVSVQGNREALASVAKELIENAQKYAKTQASFTLRTEQQRITLTAANDTDLPDGSYEQVFDRFTTLSNGAGGSGLGLAHVKDVVKAHDGRVFAAVENGTFVLRIDL